MRLPSEVRLSPRRLRGRGLDPALRRRPKATLELPDQTLKLAGALAEGRVLGVQPGDRGHGLGRARLPPAGDATPGGADALRTAAC